MSTSTKVNLGSASETTDEPMEGSVPAWQEGEEIHSGLLDTASAKPSLLHQARELFFVLLLHVRRRSDRVRARGTALMSGGEPADVDVRRKQAGVVAVIGMGALLAGSLV